MELIRNMWVSEGNEMFVCVVVWRVEPCVVVRLQSPDNREKTSGSAREMRIAGDQEKGPL
jgi:hypothetical protein